METGGLENGEEDVTPSFGAHIDVYSSVGYIASLTISRAAFGAKVSCKRLPLSVASPFHGCDEGADESINGTIVIVGRGTCQFLDKVRRMQAKGARGVVVANNEGDHIFSMDHDEAHSGSGVNIPSVMISQYDGYDVAKAVSENFRPPVRIDWTGRPSHFSLSHGAAVMHGRIFRKAVISQKCHVDDLVEAVDETAKGAGDGSSVEEGAHAATTARAGTIGTFAISSPSEHFLTIDFVCSDASSGVPLTLDSARVYLAEHEHAECDKAAKLSHIPGDTVVLLNGKITRRSGDRPDVYGNGACSLEAVADAYQRMGAAAVVVASSDHLIWPARTRAGISSRGPILVVTAQAMQSLQAAASSARITYAS